MSDWHTYYVKPESGSGIEVGSVWVHNAGAVICDQAYKDAFDTYTSLGSKWFADAYKDVPSWLPKVFDSHLKNLPFTKDMKKIYSWEYGFSLAEFYWKDIDERSSRV